MNNFNKHLKETRVHSVRNVVIKQFKMRITARIIHGIKKIIYISLGSTQIMYVREFKDFTRIKLDFLGY